MRYTIGVRIVENNGDIADGIFAYDKYGIATALCKNEKEDIKENEYRAKIFNNIEDVRNEVKEFAKSYRKEFHKRAKKYNLDISEFRFFVLKVDTPKFKYKIGEEYKIANKHKPYKMFYVF